MDDINNENNSPKDSLNKNYETKDIIHKYGVYITEPSDLVKYVIKKQLEVNDNIFTIYTNKENFHFYNEFEGLTVKEINYDMIYEYLPSDYVPDKCKSLYHFSDIFRLLVPFIKENKDINKFMYFDLDMLPLFPINSCNIVTHIVEENFYYISNPFFCFERDNLYFNSMITNMKQIKTTTTNLHKTIFGPQLWTKSFHEAMKIGTLDLIYLTIDWNYFLDEKAGYSNICYQNFIHPLWNQKTLEKLIDIENYCKKFLDEIHITIDVSC